MNSVLGKKERERDMHRAAGRHVADIGPRQHCAHAGGGLQPCAAGIAVGNGGPGPRRSCQRRIDGISVTTPLIFRVVTVTSILVVRARYAERAEAKLFSTIITKMLHFTRMKCCMLPCLEPVAARIGKEGLTALSHGTARTGAVCAVRVRARIHGEAHGAVAQTARAKTDLVGADRVVEAFLRQAAAPRAHVHTRMSGTCPHKAIHMPVENVGDRDRDSPEAEEGE